MTSKDYIAIAAAIVKARDKAITPGEQNAVELTAVYIADVLMWDNERFDRSRFMRATRGET